MEHDTITAIAGIGTFLVALIGLIVAGRRFYRQNSLTLYATYTKRCAEIMNEMPVEILYNENSIGDYEKFKKCIFLYFDLCSEEYFLYQQGHIESYVWNEWKEGMKAFFEKVSVNTQLLVIKDKYKDAYPDFIDFLKYELQIKNL